LSADPAGSVLERIATLLNRNVHDSTRARALAAELEGRALELDVEGTPITLYFVVRDGSLAIETRRPEGEPPVDASLSGTPLALLSLIGPDADERRRGTGLRVVGDAEVAQRFRELLSQAQPDAEEELARLIGDVAAHQVATLARGFLGWGRKAVDSLGTNVAEFLQEEGRDVPTRVELVEFLGSVDDLREATDRFEARLARLETRGRGSATS
jgi:ubiquinone biosynthesis protein UbiJ